MTTYQTSAVSVANPSREIEGDTIIFRRVLLGDSAVYQCNASNEHGYLLANAFVNILGEDRHAASFCIVPNSVTFLESSNGSLCFLSIPDMPPRVLGPKNQLIKVIQNQRTFLHCPFFGSPIPTLRW